MSEVNIEQRLEKIEKLLINGQKNILKPIEFAARLEVTLAHVYNMKSQGLIPEQCIIPIGAGKTSPDYRIDWSVWLEYNRRKNGGIMFARKIG